MICGFGGSGGPMAPSWMVEWRRTLTVLAFSAFVLVAAVFVVVLECFGGCTALPDVRVLDRRNAICHEVQLDNGCFLSPRRLVAGTIRAGEQEWSLAVAGEHVGTFAMPAGSMPVDPAQCADGEWVAGLLRFHTGGALVQEQIRRRFPQVGPRDVVYFDTLLGSERLDGQCVIEAELLVVSR